MKKRIINLVILTLIFCVGFSFSTAYAEDTGAEDTGLELTQGDYQYTETQDAVTITKYTGADATVTVPAEINGKPVKAIGDNAFKWKVNITNLTLPGSLETIGNSAFYGCKFTSITLPEGVKRIGNSVFDSCPNLKTITLPDSLESIGGEAFFNCDALTSVKLPSNLKNLGDSAFKSCSGLTSIEVPEGVTNIRSQTFFECYNLQTVTLPSGITEIGANAFKSCFKLETIVLPDGITSIGESAFSDCHVLTSINMPADLKVIKASAFSLCRNLSEIEIPDGVESIEDSAFEKCWALKSVKLPANLKTIGANAFNSVAITSVVLPDGLETIGHNAFQNCTKLTSVEMPNSVTVIGDSVFQECSTLSNVKLSESIKALGVNVFNSCYAITSVELPDGIESIGEGCFSSCSNLTSIDLPLELRTIGGNAFADCRKLKEIYFSPKIDTVGNDAFYDNLTLKDVYVRDTKNFFEHIQFGTGQSNPTTRTGVKTHVVFNLKNASFGDYGFVYDGTEHVIAPVCEEVASGDLAYDELKVTEPGTYELVVRSANPKTCYGEKTLRITVAKKHLEESDVSISGMKDRTYTGKALKQSLTIALGDQTLTEGTDYKVYYEKNTSVGIALVDIVFRGNYSGTIENLNFTVNPAAASVSKLTPGTKKLTVKMSAKPSSKGASTYQIGYKKKGSLLWKYTTTTSQSKTIKSLKKGKRYYVKVRAYKTVNSKKYYGAWSKTKLSSTIK